MGSRCKKNRFISQSEYHSLTHLGIVDKIKLLNSNDTEKKLYYERKILDLQSERKEHEKTMAGIDKRIKAAQDELDKLGKKQA